MSDMKEEPVLIEKYKGVPIYYNKNNGHLVFGFEGRERDVKYIFEAREIIDEPIWEDCNLEGYFKDGTFNDHIGLAKAEKKDVKSGNPAWMYKGRYDTDYKKPNYDAPKVYPKNEKNNAVYAKWKKEKEKLTQQERVVKNIVDSLALNNQE